MILRYDQGMTTHHESIGPNHPAVEAVELAAQRWIADTTGKARSGTPYMLSVALPHLTADDLRGTPAGRELMAEAWDQAVDANDRAWNHAYDGHPVNPDSPYYECTSCDTTNPYRAEEGK